MLDSTVGPDAAGPGLTREAGPADAAALRDWAAWAAAHDGGHGLGTTRAEVLATVDRIRRSPAGSRCGWGQWRVSAPMVPGLLLTALDTDEAYGEFSGRVAALRDAAAGRPVTPPSDLAAQLGLFTTPSVLPELGLAATTANQCADRAADRDPETYYRDIQEHRAAEPHYGPLLRRITPCAFWPAGPVEPPTRDRQRASGAARRGDRGPGRPLSPASARCTPLSAVRGCSPSTARTGTGSTSPACAASTGP